MPNSLIHETSPYLRQHAYQPIDWLPYSESVFELAKQHNKPIIISIGYSTCHWCHVMAHECFDDKEVADVQNRFFISVKVDREELPDVDKYYMNAMQVLTGHGGWPLNVFVLPDKKMFYGLTYLPKEKWIEVLKKIHQLYTNEKNKLVEYAENIHNGIKQFELSNLNVTEPAEFSINKIKTAVHEWKSIFDTQWGGHQYTPKFVMPVNYKFLLQYYFFTKDPTVQKHIQNSITHIALMGLFDHVGGGFYRYSTDRYWKIPHFEKMLYDNAQLIELLALYYIQFPQSEIKWITEKNIQACIRDFLSSEHLFYSAWDADSEGEEGKFYVWTKEELKHILQNDYSEFSDIFNISNEWGHWEKEYYVLTINMSLFYQEPERWMNKINQWTKLLYEYRKKRVHPSIDTKIITSWNALMIKALATASVAFKNPGYLELAEQCMHALLKRVWKDEQLYRIYHSSEQKIPAYLDDYAFLIEALIYLAKVTGNTSYLEQAISLTEWAIDLFYTSEQKLFYYSHKAHSVPYSIELYDDVIPSALAQMLNNLLYLYHLSNRSLFKNIFTDIFQSTFNLFFKTPLHSASYGHLQLNYSLLKDIEITFSGKEALLYMQQVYSQIYFINTIYTTRQPQAYSIFQNKFHPQKTFIYVCQHSICYEAIENPAHFDITAYIRL